MINTASLTLTKTKLPLIADNYEEVLFNEVPILYTGTNRQGDYIIGSSVDEDYSINKEQYFHLIVTYVEFLNFKSRKVSYLDLLKDADLIYLVEKNIKAETDTIFEILFSEIPDIHKPLATSFYPEFTATPTLNYETILTGKTAELHKASPADTANTQVGFSQVTETALSHLGVPVKTYTKAAGAGSYKLSYEIEITATLFTSEENAVLYLNKYLEYILTSFPYDAIWLVNQEFNQLDKFNELFNFVFSLSKSGTETKEDIDESKVKLAKSICSSIESVYLLSSGAGDGFNDLTVANLTSQGEISLGVINKDYKTRVEIARDVVKKSGLDKPVHLVTDPFPKVYKIHVYDFNKTSGYGIAWVINEEDLKKESKARFHINKYKKRGASSIFTESLHNGTTITVMAKATHKPDGSVADMEIFE